MAADVARGSARRLSAPGDAASECAELSFGVAAPGPGGESRRVSFASQAPPPPQAWTGRSEAVARRTWSSLTEQEILFTQRERRPSEPAGEAPPGALEAPAPVQRRKWASITEEAIGQGGCSRRGSAGLWGSPPSLGASQPQPEVLPAYGQPPRVEPAYPSQAYSPQQQQHQDHAEHIARRRWASMSEDDSASSQMHWALRQPHIQALRGGAPSPPSGYAMASHWQAPCGQPGAQAPCPRGPCPPSAGAIPPYSLQPPPFYAAPTPGCCGGVQHPGGYPPPPLPAGHWGAPSASSSRSAPAYGPWQMGPGGPHGQHGARRQQPHAPAASSAWQGWEGASPGGGRHPGGAAWAHASAHGRPAKASLLWIGEGAMRGPAWQKESIESLGFVIKGYRNSDKCFRALERKPAGASTILVSQAEALPVLQRLRARSEGGVHVVVDADGASPPDAQALRSGLPAPEASRVTVATCWDEVLLALRAPAPPARPARQAPAPAARYPPRGQPPGVGAAPGDVGDPPRDAWTLIWISDQAFKPAAAALKDSLEALGCQVKGYKTHKNAARALDKKRTLPRSMVLVSGLEASHFLNYVASRPEFGATKVIVEQPPGPRHGAVLHPYANCLVVEDFDSAAAAVRQLAVDQGFVLPARAG